MKNKRLAFLIGLLALSAAALRADWVYNQNIVTNSPVTYSQNYVLNLNSIPNQAGISRLSAQAIYSSATVASATFTDGEVSTAAITVASVTGLAAVAASEQITVTPTATLLATSATNQITIVSTAGISAATLTYYNGTSSSTLKGGVDWFATLTTTGTAASIASALSGFQSLQVSRTNSVISLSATATGTSGNSFRLATSSPSAISLGATSFVGGHPASLTNAYLTINGNVYAQGTSWQVTDTSSGTATSIASLMNVLSGMSASASGSVVYATATTAGAAANGFTVTSSSQGYLTVANPTFTGGIDNAKVIINGVTLTQGTNWTAQSTASGTAKAISDAIAANTTLHSIVNASFTTTGIVTSTSTTVGLLSNYSLSASPSNKLTVSHPTYVGGLNSAYTINSGTVNIPNQAFSTGYPVLYTSAGSFTIRPLVNQTTYYVVSVDANDIQLSTTSANAQAGAFIVLTSSSVAGPHTFTLAPLTITGIASFKWQVSNDCVNYQDLTTTASGVAVSSVTFGSPYNATSTSWDFGAVNYQCIQAAVVAPTTGGMNLQLRMNGKNL